MYFLRLHFFSIVLIRRWISYLAYSLFLLFITCTRDNIQPCCTFVFFLNRLSTVFAFENNNNRCSRFDIFVLNKRKLRETCRHIFFEHRFGFSSFWKINSLLPFFYYDTRKSKFFSSIHFFILKLSVFFRDRTCLPSIKH